MIQPILQDHLLVPIWWGILLYSQLVLWPQTLRESSEKSSESDAPYIGRTKKEPLLEIACGLAILKCIWQMQVDVSTSKQNSYLKRTSLRVLFGKMKPGFNINFPHWKANFFCCHLSLKDFLIENFELKPCRKVNLAKVFKRFYNLRFWWHALCFGLAGNLLAGYLCR